jgi:hypothetical protein
MILAGNEADLHESEDRIIHSEEVTVQRYLGCFIDIETCASIGMGLNVLKVCLLSVASGAQTQFAARSGWFWFPALMRLRRIDVVGTESENRRQVSGQNEKRIDSPTILRI